MTFAILYFLFCVLLLATIIALVKEDKDNITVGDLLAFIAISFIPLFNIGTLFIILDELGCFEFFKGIMDKKLF